MMKTALSTIGVIILLPAVALAVTLPSIIIKYGPTKALTTQLYSSQLPNALQYDFSFTSQASSTVINGSSNGSTTEKDVVFNDYTSADVLKYCTVSSSVPGRYISATPSIGTIDQNGSTTIVSNGTAQFNEYYNYRTRAVFCNMQNVISSTTMTFYGMATTSLSYNISSTTAALIKGLSVTNTTANLLSTYDPTHHIYIRNQNLWASTTDLTSIPVDSSSNGRHYYGALVAPDTILSASHVGCATQGQTLYFVAGTSTVISTVVGTTTSNINGTDICVAEISPAIATSTGIQFAQVMASGTLPYWPYSNTCVYDGTKLSCLSTTYQNIPCIYYRYNGGGSLSGADMLIGSVNFFGPSEYGCAQPASSDPWYNWYQQVSGGDSAGATGIIVNGKFVLLGTFHYVAEPSDIMYNIPGINAAMTADGSAYQLSTTSLSSFLTL